MAKQRFTIYLTQAEIQTLREQAAKVGKSVSGYCAALIRQTEREERFKAIDKTLNFEDRLIALFAKGEEQIKVPLRAAEDLLAKEAVYSCAVFELIKKEFSDLERKDALKTAVRRIKQPLDAAISEDTKATAAPPELDDESEEPITPPRAPVLEFSRKKHKEGG